MGFFKTPPPAPPRKKVKKVKGPKFLTKKLKEKERYDVLAELFEDVNLKALEKRNNVVVEEKEEHKKEGEFSGVSPAMNIEIRVPGSHRLGES